MYYLVCLLSLCALVVTGCATDIRTNKTSGHAQLAVQDRGLAPGNGGQLIAVSELRPGDIILSSTNEVTSLGIRLMTLSPVSHAALYLGPSGVAEAVGSGIRSRDAQLFVQEEATVVAFRHPDLTPEHVRKMNDFVAQHLGEKYNYVGVVLQVPFTLERRVCELPLTPPLVRDFCARGIAAIQLGIGGNDRFFCSQFVLEAFRHAGLSLTDADPRMMSPDDLLHMRNGDVNTVRIHQPLVYLGHLKAPPDKSDAHLAMD
jgi:cell wall-associated NlpC family hydrolase